MNISYDSNAMTIDDDVSGIKPTVQRLVRSRLPSGIIKVFNKEKDFILS